MFQRQIWSAVSWHCLPQLFEGKLFGIHVTRMVRFHFSYTFYVWDKGNQGSLYYCAQGWSACLPVEQFELAFTVTPCWESILRLASPQLLATEKFSRKSEEQGNIESHRTCFLSRRCRMCRELHDILLRALIEGPTQETRPEFHRELLQSDHMAEYVNYGKVWRMEMPSPCIVIAQFLSYPILNCRSWSWRFSSVDQHVQGWQSEFTSQHMCEKLCVAVHMPGTPTL